MAKKRGFPKTYRTPCQSHLSCSRNFKKNNYNQKLQDNANLQTVNLVMTAKQQADDEKENKRIQKIIRDICYIELENEDGECFEVERQVKYN